MFKTLSLNARVMSPAHLKQVFHEYFLGICFCLLVVLASCYLSDHYGVSHILGALLLGMALNRISDYEAFAPGLDFCAKNILRLGVALLGARITFLQIAELGVWPLAVVLTVVVATIGFSLLLAKLLKVNRISGILSGVAVGVCGVSAAMAVASVLQQKIQHDKVAEQHLLCTLVGVTGLSTICMTLYPGLLASLGFNTQQMGIFIGASIHDVAQVFGAGQMISPEVADLATYTKMLRVTLLIPVVVILACVYRAETVGRRRVSKVLPPFLLLFVGFIILANTGVLSAPTVATLGDVSRVCLWLAMAALGAKTNLVELLKVGRNPFILLLANTIFIAVLSLVLVLSPAL
ncbi:MAG TPA: putative sulfate exporter family transporter [Marinagarivorans sp.]